MADERKIGFCDGCGLGQNPEYGSRGDRVIEVKQYSGERPGGSKLWLCEFCASTPFGNPSRARGVSLGSLRYDLHEALATIYHKIERIERLIKERADGEE